MVAKDSRRPGGAAGIERRSSPRTRPQRWRSAVILATHGSVVAGSDLDAACNAIEELEATARLALLLRGTTPAMLTPQQVADLVRLHDVAWGE